MSASSAEAGSPKPAPPLRKATPRKTTAKKGISPTIDAPPVRTSEPAGLDDLVNTDLMSADLINADIPEAAHIDEKLVKIARASVVAVHAVPVAATQLELALTDAEAVVPPASTDRAYIPLWARVAADPGYAAEHAARQAVDRLGPEARDWVARAVTRYPLATSDGLARLAAQDSVRAARRQGAATGAAGVLGSVVATGMLARGHARLVLTIAAAYGYDPTAAERVRDLLVVLRVPRLTQPTPAALHNAARAAASFAARRVAARVMPLGAAVAGATIGARSTRDVADRAMSRYRGLRT